jgi:CHASE2 domain-containing sensor protein
MLRSWHHILLPLAILGLAIAAWLREPVAVINVQFKVFDIFQCIEPQEYTPLLVRIVDLDDASLKKPNNCQPL